MHFEKYSLVLILWFIEVWNLTNLILEMTLSDLILKSKKTKSLTQKLGKRFLVNIISLIFCKFGIDLTIIFFVWLSKNAYFTVKFSCEALFSSNQRVVHIQIILALFWYIWNVQNLRNLKMYGFIWVSKKIKILQHFQLSILDFPSDNRAIPCRIRDAAFGP